MRQTINDYLNSLPFPIALSIVLAVSLVLAVTLGYICAYLAILAMKGLS
jgi:succinate dehydrogenase hydrophobic anchor subunit